MVRELSYFDPVFPHDIGLGIGSHANLITGRVISPSINRVARFMSHRVILVLDMYNVPVFFSVDRESIVICRGGSPNQESILFSLVGITFETWNHKVRVFVFLFGHKYFEIQKPVPTSPQTNLILSYKEVSYHDFTVRQLF